MADVGLGPDILSHPESIQGRQPLPRPPFIPRTEAQPAAKSALTLPLEEGLVRSGSSSHPTQIKHPPLLQEETLGENVALTQHSINPFVDLIQNTLRERRTTADQLSLKAGYERGRISKILQGGPNIEVSTIARIAQAARWSGDELFQLVMSYVPEEVVQDDNGGKSVGDNETIPGTFGEQIRAYRLRNNISRKELEEKGNFSSNLTSKIELKGRIPTIKTFAKWAHIIRLSKEQIVSLVEQAGIEEQIDPQNETYYKEDNKPDLIEFGDAVVRVLSDKGISLKALGKAIGLAPDAAYSFVKDGPNPLFTTVRSLAEFAGWDRDVISGIVQGFVPEDLRDGVKVSDFPLGSVVLDGEVGTQLDRYRSLRGISQTELARRTGISLRKINILPKNTEAFRSESLATLIHSLGLNTDQIYGLFSSNRDGIVRKTPSRIISSWFQDVLSEKDMSIRSAGLESGVDHSTISKYINPEGFDREPSLAVFAKLAEFSGRGEEEIYTLLVGFVPDEVMLASFDKSIRSTRRGVFKGSSHKQLLNLMRRTGMSHGEIVQATGIDKSTITRLFNGERSMALSTFAKMAVGLRMDTAVVKEYLSTVAMETGFEDKASPIPEIAAIQAETEIPVETAQPAEAPALEQAEGVEDEERPASWMRYDQVTREVFDHAVEAYTRIIGYPPRGKIDYSQLEQLKDLQGKGFLQWGEIGNPLEARRQLGQDKELFVRFSASAFSEKPVYLRKQREFEREMEKYMQEKGIAIPAGLTRGRHMMLEERAA